MWARQSMIYLNICGCACAELPLLTGAILSQILLFFWVFLVVAQNDVRLHAPVTEPNPRAFLKLQAITERVPVDHNLNRTMSV